MLLPIDLVEVSRSGVDYRIRRTAIERHGTHSETAFRGR